MPQIVIKRADGILELWMDAIRKLGEGDARRALSRALNHETAKALTKIRRALVEQTSIPRAVVNQNTRSVKSTPATLSSAITATGKPMPLGVFSPVQFSYGARAKVWGRFQQYKGTFIIESYRGQVFKRLGSARGPIRELYGPGLGNELLKNESVKTFEEALPEVGYRAVHEIQRLLDVKSNTTPLPE